MIWSPTKKKVLPYQCKILNKLHGEILITSGTQRPTPFRVLHCVLLKDTGWCVHGKWGTTHSPSLQCTMVSTPQWPLDVPSKHTAARYHRLSLTQVYFKSPWLLSSTLGLLHCYCSPLAVPYHKGCILCVGGKKTQISSPIPGTRGPDTRVRHCIRLR